MIVDSSALVAIVRVEPEAEALLAVMRSAATLATGAPTALETSMVLGADQRESLAAFLVSQMVDVVPFAAPHLHAAQLAFATYGKGGGSRAQLDFGDCMSYALAKVSGEPLLFKGDDFSHTDITPAWTPDVS